MLFRSCHEDGTPTSLQLALRAKADVEENAMRKAYGERVNDERLCR